MLADIIERQQIETKNTMSFLRYVLGKRAPKDTQPGDKAQVAQSISAADSPPRQSEAFQSRQGANYTSMSMHSQATEMTFRSPNRVSVMERARSLFGDTYHRRPADLMKHQIRQNQEFRLNATAMGAVDLGT